MLISLNSDTSDAFTVIGRIGELILYTVDIEQSVTSVTFV